ncbi:hypothetical protein GOBAR_DD31703 [Gossypium barbadense]|nr:hypothetical protein GOBAR_DD31703 [Gossypium barbadense]
MLYNELQGWLAAMLEHVPGIMVDLQTLPSTTWMTNYNRGEEFFTASRRTQSPLYYSTIENFNTGALMHHMSE